MIKRPCGIKDVRQSHNHNNLITATVASLICKGLLPGMVGANCKAGQRGRRGG